jgi:hypothetical protein
MIEQDDASSNDSQNDENVSLPNVRDEEDPNPENDPNSNDINPLLKFQDSVLVQNKILLDHRIL